MKDAPNNDGMQASSNESDVTLQPAFTLWEDCVEFLDNDGYLPSILSILRNCGVGNLTDDTLTLYTPYTFTRKKIREHRGVIEGYLQEVAGRHIHITIELVTTEEAAKFPKLQDYGYGSDADDVDGNQEDANDDDNEQDYLQENAELDEEDNAIRRSYDEYSSDTNSKNTTNGGNPDFFADYLHFLETTNILQQGNTLNAEEVNQQYLAYRARMEAEAKKQQRAQQQSEKLAGGKTAAPANTPAKKGVRLSKKKPTAKLISVETRVTKDELLREEKRHASIDAGITAGNMGNEDNAGNADTAHTGAPANSYAPTSSQEPAQTTSKTHANTHKNPYQETVPNVVGSKLTFDRFVQGEENMFAFQAAQQVACGINSQSYNPLFIYSKSGLGKTHLLRAIQNYIIQNDPERVCIYKTATEFVDEYTRAWQSIEHKGALYERYKHVDVLIIDDIQNMRTAAGTIKFFFDTFNTLMASGKQIVLAADRSPQELQMGESKFDERETSRMDSGVTVTIQVPNYELKYNLINSFYDYMHHDAENNAEKDMLGTITPEQRAYMARLAGSNIRVIEGFVHTCLMQAGRLKHLKKQLTDADILAIAEKKWPKQQKTVTMEQVQHVIEMRYGVDHKDLIGNKRNKELMEPRHVCIWLIRELTDSTLADIGEKFGNRTHATIKHSITWVNAKKKEDRLFYDRLVSIKQEIQE